MSDSHNYVVAAIPATGWRARYKDDDDTTFVGPIVCWIVTADGSVEPVSVDCFGVSDNPIESSNFDRLLAPDEADDLETP
ncbi:hypothetical protein OHA57_04605 [Streptomyces anulatus]|uniref:hypothetical protein n=1 Tax=Streptomyces anulatus TaxID=1892 RepID=UPI002DD99F2A|nr:hypothetical protein [Streptomyces anulatus]WSC60059.1 hypothetical protein OHA57_04605 [Streptomyces anulatus]